MSVKFRLFGADGPVFIHHWAKPQTALYGHDLIGVIPEVTDLQVLDASYVRLVAQGLLREVSDIVVLPAPRSVAIRHKFRLTDVGKRVTYRSLAKAPRHQAISLSAAAKWPAVKGEDWLAHATAALSMPEPVFAC